MSNLKRKYGNRGVENPFNTKGSIDLNLMIDIVGKSDIASIGHVVTELLNIIQDEKSSAKDLKDITSKDPPLCARLLKLANSVYYGYSRKISDIQEAIVCIGFDAMLELALTQKVCELFVDKEVRPSGFSLVGLWRHSTAVAIFCKMLYRREFREKGDDVYAAGLLHDIGIIVEDQTVPTEFERILSESARKKQKLSVVEKEILKINHLGIGKALAQNWGFPENLIQAIAFHDNPELADNGSFRFVATVYLANYICQQRQVGYIGFQDLDSQYYHILLEKLGVKGKAVEIIMDEVIIELGKLDEKGWFSK